MLLNWQLSAGFDGADFYSLNPSTIVIVGGRTSSGFSNQVQTLEMQQCDSSKTEASQAVVGKITAAGSIGEGRWEHKIYVPRLSSWMVIFGGKPERPIETYSIDSHQIAVNDQIEAVLQGFKGEVSKLTDSFMRRYLLLGEKR